MPRPFPRAVLMRVPFMKTALIVVIALMFFAGGAPAAELVLKENVNATADVVVLDDFFEGAGMAGETPLFRAPQPGRYGLVRIDRLAAAVKRLGMDWTAPANVGRIRVTREVKTVYRDDVAELIRRELAGTMPEIEGPEDLDVQLPTGFRPVAIVDGGVNAGMVVDQLEVVPSRRSFRARVSFGGGERRISHSYEGRFSINRKVPVLARSIGRGGIVMYEDVTFERMADSRIGDALMTPGEIIGKAARRALGAGQPVRVIDLEEPRVVNRNQLVTISYRIPGMTLTSRGRAIGEAPVGGAVSVVNLQSNRTVVATATGPGQVTVADFGAGLQVAANR